MVLKCIANLLLWGLWGVSATSSTPVFNQSSQLVAFTEIEDLCESTGGNWHHRLFSCTCPANELFWIQYGCQLAPNLSQDQQTGNKQIIYLGPYDLHVQNSSQQDDNDLIEIAITHNQANALLPGITLYDTNEGPSLLLSNILPCVMSQAKTTWLSNVFVDADMYTSPWDPMSQHHRLYFDTPSCIKALGNTGLADAGVLCRAAQAFLSYLILNQTDMLVRDDGVRSLQGDLYDSQQKNLFEWFFLMGHTPVRYRIHAYDGVILQRHIQVLSRQARLVLYLSAQGAIDAVQLDIYAALPEWTQYFSSQWQPVEDSCYH